MPAAERIPPGPRWRGRRHRGGGLHRRRGGLVETIGQIVRDVGDDDRRVHVRHGRGGHHHHRRRARSRRPRRFLDCHPLTAGCGRQRCRPSRRRWVVIGLFARAYGREHDDDGMRVLHIFADDFIFRFVGGMVW